MPADRPPPLISPYPQQSVSQRLLAAEAAASAALALVQCPTTWLALATLSLMQDAAREYVGSSLGDSLIDLLADAMTTPGEATEAHELFDLADHTARAWAR